MPKPTISLGAAVVVVLAALCLPAAAADAAGQPAKATVAAKKHPKKHVSQATQPPKPAVSQLPRGCTWPYTNQYPPCQSTWPAGDPNYHGGSHPGPTFDD